MITRILSALVLFAAAATPVAAQTCGTAETGSCSVSGLNISISFTRAFRMALSSSTTGLTVPTPAHYNAGFAPTDGPVVTIASNADWSLAINAMSATWTASNTQTEAARTTKPSTDLTWSTSVGGTFAGMPATPGSVQVQSGSATAATVISLFYRTVYAWGLDTPGNYSIQIRFTLTAP